MTRTELIAQIKEKRSLLCVGLDSDAEKLPAHLKGDVFAFNRAIIDATHESSVAYKINTAFYEARTVQGWEDLENTVDYIRTKYPDHFVIADAKRGDIGNTSTMYAKAFFDKMDCHAVTVAPYMGEDSVKPFLDFPGKWAIVLALTSNAGSKDFQVSGVKVQGSDRVKLFEEVITTAVQWGNVDNMMFVIGATKASLLADIRKIIPDHFLLIPGVGAQGGNLGEVCKYGMNADGGLLINASRTIIFASNGEDYAEKAKEEAKRMQREMAGYLK